MFLTAACLLLTGARLGAQDLVISEFLASNDSGLLDSDGELSDWIEVWNPGSASVNLGGWHLTDDADDLNRWTFPPVTLPAGQYLVVFASDKDRAVAGSELHTSFKLSKEADYLALVRPDGATVAHDYGPIYPPQHDDISYGIGEGGTSAQLTALGAEARFRVPSNDADGLAWTLPGFDDGAWAPAAIGVGHETGAGEPPPPGEANLALNAGATQSSEYGGFPAELAVDGNPGNFTATSSSDPSPAWEVDLGGVFPLSSIVVRNRGDGCCPSRLRDIRVSVLDGDGEAVFESALLNPENTLGGGGAGGPADLTLDLLALAGGTVPGRHVRVARVPDPDNSGTGGAGGADEGHVLSLGEVEVFAAQSAYSEWIRTDVGPAMRGVSASLHLRIPFEISDPGLFERLSLRMRYDDGFVAYLNGTEVARRNAPGQPGGGAAWNASATAEHSGVSPEEIDITIHLGLLVAGNNLLAVHGLSSSAADEDFLILPELEARAGQGRTLVFFQNPTPGAPNDPSGVIDFVADTRFSIGRGFFEEPFEVEITSETPGAQVRYTLDRSAPTATTGLAVEGPLRITATTVLRAAAFKQGFAPTNVDTQTYIFLDDVLKQPTMLKDIVSHAVYGPELKPSLMAVPTVSVVTRATLNPATEVEASIELINPDGTDGFQIDAGVKKVGGHSVGAYPKNNMRLYFRKKYGQGKLEYPLFKGLPYGDRGVEEFDRLNLRSSHDTIFYLGDAQQSPADAQYIRNRWINYTQFEMGHPSMNGRFVQVYINGTYWGLYDFMEWPSQDYLSAHFGGESADYAATSGGRPIGDSSIAAWNRIVGLAGNYPELGRYLDLTNFADYLILNFYCGNAWDWNPNQNWMAGGPVAPDQGGFKLFCWDSDIILRRTNDYNLDRGGPGNLYQSLKSNPEFRVLLGDRAHRHLSGSGALTPAHATRSYTARADEIRSALVAETARWRWGNRVWTRDNQWQKELTRLLGDFIPRRTAIVLDQLRQVGLYSRIAAPTLSQRGGLVPAGFGLSISAPEGTVYYTTDGSDPRLPGGAVNPAAMEIGVAAAATLLPSGAPARAFVPLDGALGLAWTQADFDDASWKAGTTGVGFEKAAGYEALIGTDVGEEAFEVNSSAYLRVAFDVGEPAGWSSLTLRMKYDDGFVAYLNGERIAAANAPDPLEWSSNASASHADNLALVFQDFDVSAHASRLQKGRNVLAIHGLNLAPTSNDFLILPEIVGSMESGGGLTIEAPLVVKARAKAGAQWSALTEAFFWLDIPLRVTEIHYHPRPWSLPDLFDADEFEFVEIQNVGDEVIDLDGIRLAGGVAFDFADGFVQILRPGDVVLVVENVEAFAERYSLLGLNIAGEYSGKLGNDGDVLRIEGPQGERILDFRYSDAWYSRTDGEGHSIVLAMADAPPGAYGEAATWSESPEIDGSPGFVEARPGSEGLQLPGDATQDAKVDISDAIALLGHLFLGTLSVLPCGDGTLLDTGNSLLLDSTGDGSVDLTDPIRLLNFLFLSGPPPVLGTSCVAMEGCPNVCTP